MVYAALLEALEEGEELVGRLVAAGSSFGWNATIEGSLLECGVGVDVGVDGFQSLVTEPQRQDHGVGAVTQHVHGAAVAGDVRRDSLVGEGLLMASGGCGVFGDEALHGVGAEPASTAGREHDIVGFASPFAEPGAQHGGGGLVQRRVPSLASLCRGT